MSLPAAERGRGFGSSAAVISNIDYQQFQQKSFSIGGRSKSTLLSPSNKNCVMKKKKKNQQRPRVILARGP
jgi:hypothetical protein